ncbi:MAG: D-alanyl-D-alanine carboxypeptidase [Ruminococcus sp.]|nr:D-alanyl-D-alanine carboxypeptidase [Ruminococcus sp.]
MKLKKKFYRVLGFVLALAMVLPGAGASALNFKPISSIDKDGKPVELTIRSKACCVTDMDSGDLIYSYNGGKELPVGTLNMIMTSLLIVEKYSDTGTLKNTFVSAGSEAYDELYDKGAPTADIQPNEKVSYYDILCAMILQSSCEAANIAALDMGGGKLAGFTKLMNDRAQQMGLKHTKFSSAHGLWTSGNYSTCEDMAVLCRYVMDNSSILKEIFAMSTYTMSKTDKHPEGTTLYNNNVLVNSASLYYYSSVKGLKTGTTTDAGGCLASCASIEGKNYLIVSLGAPTEILEQDKEKGKDDPDSVFAQDYIYYNLIDHINIYNWCKTYLVESDFLNPDSEVRDVKVLYGDKNYANLKAKTGFSRVWPSYIKTEDVKREITVKENIVAPVEVGDVLGEMKLSYNGETIATLELVSTTKVTRSESASRWEVAKSYFRSKVFYVTLALICGLIVVYTVVHVVRTNRKYLKKNAQVHSDDNRLHENE